MARSQEATTCTFHRIRGACSDDSGRPAFESTGSNGVLGFGSFVFNSKAAGSDNYLRVDTLFAQEFINPYQAP